ncbi:MAG: J domain-containing protein [Natronomonas sp.]
MGGVVVESLLSLPRWVYVGVFLGSLLSVGVTAAFLVGSRLFPEENGRSDGNASSDGWNGTKRRRSEIREYLDEIDEPYSENTTIDGQTVAFYLPDNDVAITFQPATFYGLERSNTHPVLVEHEMPGINLGHRLPFETPEIDFGTESDADTPSHDLDGQQTAFDVLELPTTAGDREVRQAYRNKMKQVHPDHGGSEEEFRRVRDAYDTIRGDS